MRTATEADVDAVVALWGRAAGPTRLSSGADAVRTLLRRDPEGLLVADRDGDVVGTLVVGWDGWRCHLYRMAVDDHARRIGIGRLLVDAAFAHARAVGARRVDAMVDDANRDGIAFWVALGFERDTHDSRWTALLP